MCVCTTCLIFHKTIYHDSFQISTRGLSSLFLLALWYYEDGPDLFANSLLSDIKVVPMFCPLLAGTNNAEEKTP